ncbi:MAG: HD domain-containing protein [Promethearchaeota archaeon]|nr:MAG: HD domain-containing protein [Candidatus Lokiarchaeota archaeon]
MKLIEKIIHALEDETDKEILSFGNYQIKENLGEGEQGGVLGIENEIGKKFALKIYEPKKEKPELTQKILFSEIEILLTLSHKNIVKIFTGGLSIWSDSNNNWDFYGLSPKKDLVKDSYDDKNKYLGFYYIMEYIKGKDVASLFSVYNKENENSSLKKELELFEQLISQISKAIIYSHSKNISHKDIKEQNIRFSEEDSNFILIDFGFAKQSDKIEKPVVVKIPDKLDPLALLSGEDKLMDIGEFSIVLKEILPSFESIYDQNRYNGIKAVINKALAPNKEERYQDMSEFYDAIRQYFIFLPRWKFSLKLNEYLTPNHFGKFNSKVRLPVSKSILLTEEVRQIIDTQEFQRLRAVRQLGPAIFVYPGANHTRFEHSLGVYSVTLNFLNQLLDLPKFKEICEPLEESIKLIILTALLHDIGHYPYSHYLEQIKEFPGNITIEKHEKRAEHFINEDGELRDVIDDVWNVERELICRLIIGQDLNTPRLKLLSSIIDSAIDVDKIDYLIRDSLHCGVDYGMGIDVERILNSLYVDHERNRTCLTDKGCSCLLSLLSCRNIMYQSVYWHKTVKACHAMFKRFIYEYMLNTGDDIRRYLDFSDEIFINTLYNNVKQRSFKERSFKDLINLISPFALNGRRLYKPAYIMSRSAQDYSHNTRKFFTKISGASFGEILNFSNRLSQVLKEISGLENLTPTDILIEKSTIEKEHELWDIEALRIYNHRSGKFNKLDKTSTEINEFLENNARVYLFCNPKYYNKLKNLDENIYSDIFGKLL